LDTASCPHCHQAVDAQAVNCRYCRTPLKAYGHPGIQLHHATGKEFLCQSCTYRADDSCTFPQRPYARECILYQDISQSQVNAQQRTGNTLILKNWLKRRQALLVLLGLLSIAFLLSLRNTQTPSGTSNPPQKLQFSEKN